MGLDIDHLFSNHLSHRFLLGDQQGDQAVPAVQRWVASLERLWAYHLLSRGPDRPGFQPPKIGHFRSLGKW
jgi:hypothetical protein